MGNHIEVMKYKQPFILTTLSLPAATVLHIGSYAERKRARKVNPLLDQSEHYFKKRLFQDSFQGRVKYVPMGNKTT